MQPYKSSAECIVELVNTAQQTEIGNNSYVVASEYGLIHLTMLEDQIIPAACYGYIYEQ